MNEKTDAQVVIGGRTYTLSGYESEDYLHKVAEYLNGKITLDIARTALDLMDVDRMGLDRADRNFLYTLIEKFGGGPAGLDTLAAAIGEDSGTLEDLVEPYLLQNGLINRTPRGRVATREAYTHLGFPYMED